MCKDMASDIVGARHASPLCSLLRTPRATRGQDMPCPYRMIVRQGIHFQTNETGNPIPLHTRKPKQPYLLRRPLQHNHHCEQHRQASLGTLRAKAVKVRASIKSLPAPKARKWVQGHCPCLSPLCFWGRRDMITSEMCAKKLRAEDMK